MLDKLTIALALMALCSCACAAVSTEVAKRAESILKQMTLEEKIDYIGGVNNMFIRPVERVGIPEIKMSDGPMGCRCYGKTTAYPGGIALTATWNPALAKRIGEAMGRDCRSRGVHILLAPAVNIYRSPLCGRNFEYMGEDPYLASTMVTPLIQGIESQGVLATVKHFACNNQEWDRHHISSEVDERTLREIYLPAFKAAVQAGKVGCVMNAYNLVNGVHCSQDSFLLTDILGKEWGFEGIVMSDWGSTYDGVAAANAGLDLEMPNGAFMNRKNLLPAVKDGRVKESVIDEKVRRILRTIIAAGFPDRPQVKSDIPADDPANVKVALDGAREAIVLLKNDKNVLPVAWGPLTSIAVIGPNAEPAVYCGGGSGYTDVFHSTSILKGVTDLAGAEVKYVSGRPVLDSGFVGPLKMQVFANKALTGEPVYTGTVGKIEGTWSGNGPAPGVGSTNFSIRWTGKIRPETSGRYMFSAGADDGVRVFLDANRIINDWADHAFKTTTAKVELEAGRDYEIGVEFYQGTGDAAIKFGWGAVKDSEAAKTAAECDAAIVCVGFDRHSEGEGHDRPFELPSDQVDLIRQVAEANPKTIVVINSGGGVAWDGWLDKVPAVLQAWYPGQEVGQAVAEIIFGDVNPSGKLPATFEAKAEDNPAFPYYHIKTDNKTPYTEGVFVGYRGYDKNNVTPAFCFGHGLSYTTFKFANLRVTPRGKGDARAFAISCDVTNTGKRAGAEVAQLYVGDPKASVPRPIHELKGFEKVLLKPGEKKTVTFTVTKDSLVFYSVDKHAWLTEPGEFTVSVGSSSRDLPLKGTLVW